MFDKHKGSKESAASSVEERPAEKAPAPTAAPSSAGGPTAMIGKGISISGDVTADSNLRIEGVIEGRSIQSKHDIEIGESGKVTASVSAKLVRIAGEVTGDINGSEKVTISKSGRVQGNVVAPRVQLEDGALFRGSIDMSPPESAGSRSPASAGSAKPTPVDSGARGAAAVAGKASEAVSEGTRKEPGLTLKSG